MIKKRIFDLTLTLAMAIVWVPALLVGSLAILVFAGWPVVYVSKRRVNRDKVIRMPKLRTMVKNADKIANRHTVPVNGTRFLNIGSDSPLYTRVGRVVEICQFTELPQLLFVVNGKMSIVGSRPLPESVISSLKQAYPNVDDRFETSAGLTGPVQLVGRDNITDQERLRLESQYCGIARSSYSILLDCQILLYTVLIAMRLLRPRSVDQVAGLLARFERRPQPVEAPLHPLDALSASVEQAIALNGHAQPSSSDHEDVGLGEPVSYPSESPVA